MNDKLKAIRNHSEVDNLYAELNSACAEVSSIKIQLNKNKLDLMRLQSESESNHRALIFERHDHKNTKGWNKILFALLCCMFVFVFLLIINYGKTREQADLANSRSQQIIDSIQLNNPLNK